MDLLPRLDLPRLPLLVGFSGGADSVALLDLLWRARAAGQVPRVAAAHLNHAIRGADADADAAF
ncbi:MAG: hypothetical protein J6333_09200, partial [Planctomycetes bacterium]|nr:hypothetical protein [Planctomycetota bacterium]